MSKAWFEPQHGLAKILWLANLLFACTIGLSIWLSYQQYSQHAQEKVENTSLTVERNLSGMLDQINLMLTSVQDELEAELVHGKIDPKGANRTINRLVGVFPGLSVVLYSDANGQVEPDAGFPVGSHGISVLDRDYFQRLQLQPGAGMVSSKPVIGKVSGKQTIVFARAYRDPAGNFAGVIFCSVLVDQFSDIFAAFQLDDDATIELIDEDLSQLASYPLPGDRSTLGRRVELEPVVAQISAGAPFVTMVTDAGSDGISRFYAARKLSSRSYWVGVGLSRQGELMPWYRQTALALAVMFVFALLTWLAGRQLQLGWRRQEAGNSVLEGTLEATDNGILVIGPDDRILHTNQHFARMWRIPEHLLATGDDKTLLAEAAAQLVNPEQLVCGGNDIKLDHDAEFLDVLEFKDGRVFERDSRPISIRGVAAGRVWSFRDISQQRRIDALLSFITQRSWVSVGESFLPALAKQLGQILGVAHVLIQKPGDEPGIVETVAFYTRGELVPNIRFSLSGTPCEKVIGKEACVFRQRIQQLFPENGLLAQLQAESYLGVPLWDSAGQPVGMIALIDDKALESAVQVEALLQLVAATAGAELERLREEKVLRRERDRAQSYLDTVDVMIVVLDVQGRVALVNRTGCQWLGCEEGELHGRLWFDIALPRPEVIEQVHQSFLEVMAGKVKLSMHMESQILTPSGKRLIAWHNTLLHDEDGQIIGTLSAGEDITERDKVSQELVHYRDHLETLVDERTLALSAALQQAEAANRAKGAFLSNMSHELRTPLNAVIGFSRLMAKSETLSKTEKINLEIINRSGEHLLMLINDVLELAKIDAGQVGLLEEDCNVLQLVQGVADMLRVRAEQAGLRLTLSRTGLPGAVRVDTTKLRQVLINLLGNAIKFTPQGSVHLGVRGASAEAGKVRIEFDVRDTGIGIAEEDQQRIFAPFVQVVTHATTAGTGLGLAITRQYLAMLGGDLTLISSPGRGSIFRFSLTLRLADQQIIASDAGDGAHDQTAFGRGKRILIVEDNEDSRFLLQQLLVPLGFEVAEAVDGLEAIEQAIRVPPDLIIMDWRMPNLDGLQATQRIRAHEKTAQTGSAKVILLTANAFEEQRQEALAAGIDAFLRKPLIEGELYAALEDLLALDPRQLASTVARTETPVSHQIDVAELAKLPSDLIVALEQAAGEMNPGKIKALLGRVEALRPDLAQDIDCMIDAFRYRELWDLLQKLR